MNAIKSAINKAIQMSEYKIEFDGGINLIFELDSHSPGEAPCFDSPGEGEEIEFSYHFEVEIIDYLDDLLPTSDGLKAIYEGECIQKLMEAEYKKNRACVIAQYINDCLECGEKIDKAFLKELGDIA